MGIFLLWATWVHECRMHGYFCKKKITGIACRGILKKLDVFDFEKNW